MMNGTGLSDGFVGNVLGKERTDILAALMFDDGSRSVRVGEQKRHGQTRLANGQSIWAELAAFISAFFGERDGGKSGRIIGTMEVLVNVKRIKSSIKRAESGAPPQPLLGLLHQWEKVGDIRLVERLGHFRQNEFAPLWDFHNDHA
jgi:hypothetical protein